MTNENSLESFGLHSNPGLKASKPRLPLQELNNVGQQEDESTAMIQARKRRVSFANVNIIKEFNAGAESLLVCHTPAYEEPFSTCSDSSNPSTHETLTPAKSTDCEDVGNSIITANNFSSYNKRASVGSSRASLGPDQLGCQDMECTDVLKTAYLSANTISGMEMTMAVQGVFSTSRLSLNSIKIPKTKDYNSMSYNGMELTEANGSLLTEGTKIMNNTSFGEMEVTEMLGPAVYEDTRTVNNLSLSGMELTKAISPLLSEASKQSLYNISKTRRRSIRNESQYGSDPLCKKYIKSIYSMSENGMEFTEVIQHHKIFENTRLSYNMTEAVFPMLQEGSRSVDTTAGSGMDLTEVLSPKLHDGSESMNNITDVGMELTSGVVPAFNERTRSMNNITSSKMELTEAVNEQYQERTRLGNNFSQSEMELTSAAVPAVNKTRSVNNMTSSKMELTEAVDEQYQERNQSVNNFSQSGMELVGVAVPAFNKTRYVNNVTSSNMEMTEAINEQYQERNKGVNNISQSRMKGIDPLNLKSCSGIETNSRMIESDNELTIQNYSKCVPGQTESDMVQSGMELTDVLMPKFKERTKLANDVTSSSTEFIQSVPQIQQDQRKHVASLTQSTMELTEPVLNRIPHAQNPKLLNDMLRIDESVENIMQIDDEIAIDVKHNSKVLNNLVSDCTFRENDKDNNKLVSEDSGKFNICKNESIVLTKVKDIMSDISIEECIKTETVRDANETGSDQLEKKTNECEIMTSCIRRKVQENEKTKGHLCDSIILEKSVNSVNVNVSKETSFHNKRQAEPMKTDSDPLHIAYTDENNINEIEELPLTDELKVMIDVANETINQSKNSFVKENWSVVSCADQSEFIIGSCSQIEMTGVAPLNEGDAKKRNQRSVPTPTTDRKLNLETDDHNVSREFNSFSSNGNAGMNNMNTDTIETEVVLSEVALIENMRRSVNNNIIRETNIVDIKGSTEYNNDVVMDLNENDCNTSQSVEEGTSASDTAHIEISSPSADRKIDSESHNTASATYDISGSVKIQNSTEINTQGSKRKYEALENIETNLESNNPSKIYVQEQISSNLENNIVNNMEVIVTTEDGRESCSNKEIVTRYTVEIGSPQSSKHVESNKEALESTSASAEKDEGVKCSMETTQSCVNDLSVHENVIGPDNKNDLYQSLANHSNITFRRKSRSLISMKRNRSQINNESSANFQNDAVSNDIGVVMNTEITITNIKLSNMSVCNSFIQDKTKSNTEHNKVPLMPLFEPIKESDNVQIRKVKGSDITHVSSAGDQALSKTNRADRNIIYNCNHVQNNSNKIHDIIDQQSSQAESNEVSLLQLIPKDFRDKWNLYEVSQGVWSLDLIPEVLLLVFKLDELIKNDNTIGIVKIVFKEICAGSEDPVNHYMAKSIMAKFSTRDMKKKCSNTSQIPCMVEHVNTFVQQTINFGKYLKVLIDIYCAVLNDRTLIFEVCSARSRLWVKVYINLESFEYLTTADITVATIKGNVEQSVIRKLFDTVKSGRNLLYEFITKVDHYIRIERSIKPVI